MFAVSANPVQVVRAVELGFDLFTGTYPYVLSMRNHALLFDYEIDSKSKENGDDDVHSEENESETRVESRAKRFKPDPEASLSQSTETVTRPVSIDLQDKA